MNTTHPDSHEFLAVPADAVDVLAASSDGVAKMFSISERHVWALDATGRIPRPIRLGRAVRWSIAELRAWLAAGAPSREEWEQTGGAR